MVKKTRRLPAGRSTQIRLDGAVVSVCRLMTEKEPDRTNRRPQIMNGDDQRQATSKLGERAPTAAPKYLHLLIWIVMVVMALLAVINILTSK
jgi:hypothetical protein